MAVEKGWEYDSKTKIVRPKPLSGKLNIGCPITCTVHVYVCSAAFRGEGGGGLAVVKDSNPF